MCLILKHAAPVYTYIHTICFLEDVGVFKEKLRSSSSHTHTHRLGGKSDDGEYDENHII